MSPLHFISNILIIYLLRICLHSMKLFNISVGLPESRPALGIVFALRAHRQSSRVSVQFIRASVGEAVVRARGPASGGARANPRSACTPSSTCTGCTRAHAGPCRTLSGTFYCQSVVAALDCPANRLLPTVSCASEEIIYFLD